MKIALKILPRTKPLRLFICFGGGILLALILSTFSHYRYWYGTMKSVQATKINIISESVPTKLSLLLVNKQEEEIQKLLDSTDGYVGLVVTDCLEVTNNCLNQNIIYQTQIDRGWGKKILQPNNLAQNSFDILTNPPPLITNNNSQLNQNQTASEILGRVYYLRLSPSSFVEELKEWLINLIKLKPQSIIHPYTAFFALTFLSVFIGLKFFEREVEKIESIAKIRQKKLEIDLNKLKKYNKTLINAQDNFNQEINSLNEDIISLQARTAKFKEEIKNKEDKQYKQEQKILKTQNILREYKTELAQTKEIKLINEEEKENLISKIQLQQKELEAQESDLKTYLEELKATNQELTLNQYKEEEILRLLRKREKEKVQLEKQLNEKENQLNEKEKQIQTLEQQKKEYQTWQELAQELEKDLDEADLLQEKVALLEKEKLDYEKLIKDLETTNDQLNISLLESQRQNRQVIIDEHQNIDEEINKEWTILCTDKFIDFWYNLSDEDKIKTVIYIDYLQQKGVTLNYPYSSDIRGSCYRELIPISHANEAIRIFYKFTPARIPILLCGGDKDGKNSERWYRKYVGIAENEYNNYLKNQEAFSFNDLWQEINPLERRKAIKKFMKI